MTASTDSQRRPVFVDRRNNRFFADPLIGNGAWPQVPLAVFYGSYAADPVSNPYGSQIAVGDLYFNTSANILRVWDGSLWQDAGGSNSSLFRWRKTAAGGETSLSGLDDGSTTLAYTPGSEFLYLNGALLARGVDYVATTGTSITGLAALTASDVVELFSFNELNLANLNAGTVAFTQSGAGAVQRTVEGKLRDVISVKDFGAVGDGVADDTAAFQAAYTAASANSTILIPFGQYNLTSSINNTKFVRWLSFGATYPGGTVPLSLPGIVETQLGRDLYRRTSTSATDSSILELQRIGSHTGGTNGFVTPAFQAYTSALAGSKNYEWAALAIIDNSSTLADGSENVAIYGQALKKADGKSWAGCLEIRDTHGAGNALGDCIGLEITAVAQNLTTDTNYQRNGIHVATSSTGAGAAEWSRGFWTSTGGSARVRECFSNTGNFCKAVFRNSGVGASTGVDTAKFIEDTGSSEIGIDLGNATYSSGIALRITSGNYIYLDQTNANGIRVSGGIIEITGSRVRPSQGLDFSSGVSGLVTTSASAGIRTLPSNPAGFLSVWIDGTNFKLPYYGA